MAGRGGPRPESVRRAHQVIEAAWVEGRPYDLASQAAFALESACLLQSPETAAEHERLRGSVSHHTERAEKLGRQLHAVREERTALAKRVAELEATRVAGSSSKLAALLAPSELTVFRASHGSIVMGLYASRDAARDHCETVLRREQPTGGLEWSLEADGVDELNVVGAPGVAPTGCVVTALTVASAYDEEADE